ncbi:30S ribosomal protein S15 [Candidatus Saccharibacteria bacterium]|nr:30S ribosomal protein S15 [Candidatus Saccharibacteria bacterium]
MKLTAKQETIKKHANTAQDTGSAEVQVALLTERIIEMTEHLKVHKKDNHSRRGLLAMVSKRRKLLNYLQRTAPDKYTKLIKELSLRK